MTTVSLSKDVSAKHYAYLEAMNTYNVAVDDNERSLSTDSYRKRKGAEHAMLMAHEQLGDAERDAADIKIFVDAEILLAAAEDAHSAAVIAYGAALDEHDAHPTPGSELECEHAEHAVSLAHVEVVRAREHANGIGFYPF
jgi:hypothetical protein